MEERPEIGFTFNWGLDGSEEHSNYHQLSKVQYTTKQIMSVYFSLSEVMLMGRDGDKVIWSSTEEGANKTQNIQLFSLFPAKENKDLLQEFIPLVENDVNRVEINGVKVLMKSGLEAIAHCRRATLSMADGKMVTTLLQLGGAYCTMCTKSQPQCHSREVIEEGFVIDRSVESLNDLALSLTDEDN